MPFQTTSAAARPSREPNYRGRPERYERVRVVVDGRWPVEGIMDIYGSSSTRRVRFKWNGKWMSISSRESFVEAPRGE